ncbi:MAG: hypothetical protein JWM56_395 [Candidatus Peribacteria bacterium]|nr:hypothetical protein [Candidatus Peribacteria bacterium]
MLYPSQERTREALAKDIDSHQFTILEGLSGSGKSLITSKAIAGSGYQVSVMEGSDVLRRPEGIRQLIGGQIKAVILAQPSVNAGAFDKKLGMSLPALKVRCLSADEVMSWFDSVEPALLPDEREYILKYSLGVPLLIERFLANRPVTQPAGIVQCVAYLQNIIDECFLARKSRNEELQQIIATYTDFGIPSDVLSVLCDCEEARRKTNAIGTIHSRLATNKEIPTPQSLQLFSLYDTWLERHPDEPSFDVFVRDVPDAEKLLEEIGYCSHPDKQALLRRFVGADARKGATYYSNPRFNIDFGRQMDNYSASDDAYLPKSILTLARAAGVTASLKVKKIFGQDIPVVQLPEAPTALFVHKHDHTPRDVMPVAYTIECALQKAGVPYAVRYNNAAFIYNPEKTSYNPLETPKINSYRELYGDLTDNDEWPDEEIEL